MINIDKVREEFNKYASTFDVKDDKIKLKKEHINRVANLCKMIAEDLKLSEEEVKLAEVIGYFHDIGRFKQVKEYDTFNDKVSVNHAEYSIKVLFEEGLIEKFDIDEKYFEIIKKAVLNHNKDSIEENLSNTELLFAKIIRDADKLDIFYVICNYELKSVFWFDGFDIENINSELIEQFKEKHKVNYNDIKNNADQILAFYAFVFDFNFDISKKYLKSKEYLDYFAQRLINSFSSTKVKEDVKIIFEISNNFLENF